MLTTLALLTLSSLPGGPEDGQIEPGLDLRAVVEERHHRAVPQLGTPFEGVGRGLQAPNREHDLRAWFLPDGLRVVQRSRERCGWRLNQGDAGVFEVTPVDALVYCTSKVNSQGCLPAIGWTGEPSASAGSGFDVHCRENRDNVNGTFFYGVNGPKFTPYQGGYLCVQGPAKRTGIQNSGGSGACTGEFHFDFNAHVASGADPSLFAGQTVWGQYWSRDAQSSFGSNRSDAIEFVIQP